MTTTTSVKDEMRQMLDRLPNDLTWDDLIYHIEVRKMLEERLKALDEGQTYTTEEVRRHLGLTQ